MVSLNLCNVLISNRSSGKQQSLVSYIPYKYGYVHGMHCKISKEYSQLILLQGKIKLLICISVFSEGKIKSYLSVKR